MLAIPAIELSGGQAVRRTEGTATGDCTGIGDARDVARRWRALGFQRLHLVDLDAARGRGSNLAAVRDILREAAAPAQVGGGIGTTAAVGRLLDDGAAWVVVGARAIEDAEWLAEISSANPGNVIVALDVRERRVHVKQSREWFTERPRDVLDVIDELVRAQPPLGGLLVTSSARAGQLGAADLALLEDITGSSPWPVIAAGAIGSIGDLRALEDRGAAGAVIVAALLDGRLDPVAAAAEFSA